MSADSTKAKSESHFCYDCARLIKNLQYMRQYKEIEYCSLQTLGFRVESQQPKCPLCAIVKDTVDKSQAAESNPVHPAGLEILAKIHHNGPQVASTSPWRVILHLNFGGLFQMLSQSSGYQRRLPLGVIDDRSKAASSARLLDKDSVDFLQIKDWLMHCRQHHTPSSNPAATVTSLKTARPNLYLIDVTDGCLVKATPGPNIGAPCIETYVALSYVWGTITVPKMTNAQLNACCKPGGLHHMSLPLPLTIVDAIEVARKLDFRFLWVDSLCIIQDDKDHLKASIAIMHLIFGEAEAVIVAADGADASAGISALRQRSAIVQRTVKALDHLTLTQIWNPWDSLALSHWYKRAWTLQERVLAQRCLIFVDGKVFMTCRTQILCASEDQEGRKVEVSASIAPASPVDINLDFDIKGSTGNSVINAYLGLASAYSNMELTYNSDIVNAFQGLYNIFQQHAKSGDKKDDATDQTWLMPPEIMDEVMLWQPARLSKRKAGLGGLEPPSWSWVVWSSQVSWPHMAADEGRKLRKDGESMIRASVKWQNIMPSKLPGLSQRLMQAMTLHPASIQSEADTTCDLGRYLVIDSSTAVLRIGNPGVLDKSEVKDISHPYDLIIALDKVGADNPNCRIPLGCCPFDCEGVQDPELIQKGYYDNKCSKCRFGQNHVIQHQHEGMHTHTAYRCCGFVNFNDADFVNRSPGDVCEYVVISESRDDRLDRKGTGQPRKEHPLANTVRNDGVLQDFHLYNIMAIAPNNDELGSYRRVGLGRIQKEAWKLSWPKAKRVVLA